MEKISRIVSGNARVAVADLKSGSAVRPGAPSYGRPVGESTQGEPKRMTTAARAAAMHNSILEGNRAVSHERAISKLADDFFMSRVRRPDDQSEIETDSRINLPGSTSLVPAEQLEAAAEEGVVEEVEVPPQEYTPRGSYVDVRA